jgi:hypothetical protein
MSQVTIRRPFGELDLCNQLRLESRTVLHLFLGQGPIRSLLPAAVPVKEYGQVFCELLTPNFCIECSTKKNLSWRAALHRRQTDNLDLPEKCASCQASAVVLGNLAVR